MQRYIYSILSLIFIGTVSFQLINTPMVKPETPVWDVLEQVGVSSPHDVDASIKGASVEIGRSLFHDGFADKPGGGTTKRQSKHFVCTSCHNTQREDPDLTQADPQARLDYAKENNLPLLQGTTLYGAVNRTSFYNDDYEKKYGKLVIPARNNIRKAIQLCAVECAQGRALKDWETESILMYLWSLQLTLNDLKLSKEEYASIEKGMDQKKASVASLIQSKYLSGSPAHFVKPPENRTEGYAYTGDAANGKLIYELSCLHCHENKRYSLFELDNNEMTFDYLERHIPRYSHASLYQVTRYGVRPLYGKRSYMPQYTAEKMSDQMVEDLRAYIVDRSE